MIANNKKNQVNFSRAIQWLTKHNAFNDERDAIESEQESETSEWRRINKKCEESFDKYLMYCEMLPKAEVKRIEKSDLY